MKTLRYLGKTIPNNIHYQDQCVLLEELPHGSTFANGDKLIGDWVKVRAIADDSEAVLPRKWFDYGISN